MTTAFYIWLYFLGVAIAHDHSLYLNQPKGRRLRRLYLFLPAIKHRARQRRREESDEAQAKKQKQDEAIRLVSSSTGQSQAD